MKVTSLAVWTILLPILATSQFLSAKLPRARPEAVGMSSERFERLDTVFEDYVSDEQLPGAVVMVLREGRVAHLGVYGEMDRESGKAMRGDAIFRIASQTKAIVSVGIMMLQEEGKLLIRHPLSEYLPEFAETTVAVANDSGGYDVVPAKREITILDLLRHTSGYGYGDGLAAEEWEAAGVTGWYFANRDEPIRETVRRMAALPAEAHPGERYVYGYNTDILGAVIEVASGQPLDTFLKERLFTPLQMNDTHFYLPRSKTDRLATVYSLDEAGTLEKAPDPGHMVGQGMYVEGPRTSFSGGAGLLSTAHDYARFLQMMANGGELDGNRILSPKTVQLMTVDHMPEGVPFSWSDGVGFGLGFSVRMDLGKSSVPDSVGSYGWGGAYHSTYWVDPVEDLVVVYFTQVIPAAGLDDHDKLRALVYQAIVE